MRQSLYVAIVLIVSVPALAWGTTFSHGVSFSVAALGKSEDVISDCATSKIGINSVITDVIKCLVEDF